MDRLQQKCFLASALLHGALLAGLVVVSAFSKPPPDVPKVALTYVPVNPRDLGAVPPAGPAAVEVTPTPPAPPPPPSPPPPVVSPPKTEIKSPPPEPPKVEPKKSPAPTKQGLLPPKDVPKAKSKPKEPARKDEPKKDEPKKLAIADTSKLTTKNSSKEREPQTRTTDADARKAAQDAAKAHADWQKNVASTLGGLRTGLSSPVSIEIPGVGGAAFYNYGIEIVRRYEASWLLPFDAGEDNSVVQVVVTLARNGHVLDARVVRPCGRAAVDKSVRETLQRVREFPPFPAGSTDEQRTFNIDFNLKAKRGSG
jgi:TonB family protein